LIKAGLLTPSRGGRPIALAAIALSPPRSAPQESDSSPT